MNSPRHQSTETTVKKLFKSVSSLETQEDFDLFEGSINSLKKRVLENDPLNDDLAHLSAMIMTLREVKGYS